MQTIDFVESIFEKFFLMYWEDKKINYDLFVSDQLADPVESIQYTMEHLVFQKKLFNEQMPFLMDKQLLRVNSRRLRLEMQDYPSDCLNKIYHMMPKHIKKISNEMDSYLS